MRYLLLLWISLISCTSVFAAQTNLNTPVGYWKTIDDVSGRVRSIMKIYNTGDSLSGQVVKTFPLPGEEPNKRCTKCEGANQNQPILGMVILTDMKENDGQWDGGRILDPLKGKKYKCLIRVLDGGKKLLVRGYIGFSLLGRSQTWIRVNR
jgi:uncharacterized protein (DUF2147 family)